MMVTACAETDLAVVRACGIETMSREEVVRWWRMRYGDEAVDPPDGPWIFRGYMSRVDQQMKLLRPSADLNDAFFAAEKFGLFDTSKHDFCLWYGENLGGWIVGHLVPARDALRVQSRFTGTTPALAICAAILKLAGA